MNNIFSKPSIYFTVIKKHFEYNSTKIDNCFKKNGRYLTFTVKPIYDNLRKYLLNLGHAPHYLSTPNKELAKYTGKSDKEYLNNIIKNYANIRLLGGFVNILTAKM